MARVGVIGGSGLYEMEGIRTVDVASLMTPFGQPSGNYTIAEMDGAEVVFLPRHGKKHTIPPSAVNYRANIFGMKKLGVASIISVSACGSLREEMKPKDFVVPDQFVDRALGQRKATFFDEDGVVVHMSMADPYAPEVRRILIESAKALKISCHDHGTYLNMEGPQFSTKAESRLYRQWGMDIIGMTNATEAKLAGEAEIAYATLAAVTDYDCWHPDHGAVTLEMVIENLKQNVANAQKILKAAVPQLAVIETFSIQGTLKSAVATHSDGIPEDKKRELDLL